LRKRHSKYKEQLEKKDKTESNLSDLQHKLSKATSEAMIMKEEKHKLRDKIDIINKEKSELVSQLIRSSLTAELVEDKINQVTTSIEMRLSTEVAGLKAAF